MIRVCFSLHVQATVRPEVEAFDALALDAGCVAVAVVENSLEGAPVVNLDAFLECFADFLLLCGHGVAALETRHVHFGGVEA